MTVRTGRLWLTTLVLGHLAVSIVHGSAHTAAKVPLSLAANLFVFIVILAGPLLGLLIQWRAVRAGAWIVAATMAGALVFGVVNHFILSSADNVTQVAEHSRLLFGVTAVLLAVTEAGGCGLALRLATERTRR